MSLSSSLNAGVAGLAANSTKLSAISDNIANSGTYGYRRASTDFHSMVTGSGGGGSYSAGGVKATTSRLITQGGTLVSTSNPTDLAVSGGGFLPVASATEINANVTNPTMMLTTTGSFLPDSRGYLVSDTGLTLMGWPANANGSIPDYPRTSSDSLEPIRLSTTSLEGSPTTSLQLGVNLPAVDTEAGAAGTPHTMSVEYFGNLGFSETLDISFTPTIPAAGAPPSNEWTMVITDSASGGAVIGEYTMTFDDSRTGGGSLASVTPIGASPAYDPTTGTAILNVAGGPLELDIGTIGGNGGMTQLGYDFAPLQINKDGSPVGTMTSVSIDENGMVHAYYSTGITKTIAQVPLVDMANPNGMATLDYGTYLPTNESGSFYLWDAGTGPTGEVVSFAREASAVDVAEELTDLIETQRAYSSSAKIIQTVDEMLQETTNIKR
ncbi:flagellar hook protein FlgE [Shimia isoporae]|uniref:Flagellar hook protein FlgE n=1 Tax=Shimia isoporae TaxID=647720 RepID=A0A4R1N3W1_9RHOB|nr:flagellar hook-basal body complex protein [Shimia isoporae]TCL01427.1 flagellar hook protein FlgE [Shimia isoporae]